MSYMVARMQKMKVGNLGGAHKHNERILKSTQTKTSTRAGHTSTMS